MNIVSSQRNPAKGTTVSNRFDLLGSHENEEQTEFNAEPALSLVERPD